MAETNAGFSIPSELEAKLRAQAEAAVAAETVDEAAILAQYVAEARAKREAELRGKAAELSAAEEGTGPAMSQGFPKKFVKLVVFRGPNKTDLSYVPVGVNGYVWKIQRGPQVIVPTVVADALNEAVQGVVVQSEGGIITRPAHSFPFSVVGEATEQEYKDFIARMKEEGRTAPVVINA